MTYKEVTQRILGVLAVISLVIVATNAIRPEHLGRVAAVQAANERVPVFKVDPSWPNLPNGWITGHVPAVSVDSHDNVWLITRPNTVPMDQQAHASPPVIEFDKNGKFVQAWGGPGAGYDWPDSDHSIFVDNRDNVWISGSSPASASPTRRTDDMVLKFTNKGKFLLQIGGYNKSNGNTDTKSVHLATDIFVYPKTNEAFVSDGYGNRRVIVFDANTGAFKRMWGAFGNPPTDWQTIKDGAPVQAAAPTAAPAPGAGARGAGGGAAAGGGGGGQARPTDIAGPGPDQFGNRTPTGGPTHSVQVSNDGLVYVADRANRRVQVFTMDGKYVTQVFINRTGPSQQSAAGIAFSPDKDQQYLYIADYGNSRIAVLERKSLQVLYQFGERSAKPGDFQGIHHIAVDSKGNIYAGEVAPGARVQKFVFMGFSDTLPPNALSQAQLDAQLAAVSAAPPAGAAAQGGGAGGARGRGGAGGEGGAAAGAGGRGPAPVSTALYDMWTQEQLKTPGNLANYGNHNASIQHREGKTAPEVHAAFSHILIFTSGTGNFVVGGQIVDGPDGGKIIQGGENHKIVLGNVWHIPANVSHWVVPDPPSPGVNYFVSNINIPSTP